MPNAPLSVGAYGDSVAHLQDFLRQRGFQLPASEVNRTFFGPATRQAVQQFQQQHNLPVSGVVDEQTAQAINAATAVPNTQTAQFTVSMPNTASVSQATSVAASLSSGTALLLYVIQGNLLFDYGLPATGITVRLYNVGFAGQDVKLGETSSDDQGNYSLSYEIALTQIPNLQLRVVDAANNEISISTTMFNAQQQEVLNLIVPGSVRPLAPEFQRLAADMNQHINGIGRLSLAQENANRQDLGLLYQTTGWDARLLALASSAATLTQTTNIGQDVLYALLRAGLPTDPQKLALVSPIAIGKALVKANQSGIVSLNDQQIATATTAFTNFANKTRLTLMAAGANSTFGTLLSLSGLPADKFNAFADLYFSQSVNADGFWQQVEALNIPVDTLNTLKLQGKLYYLTFNNAQLVQSLQKDLGSLGNLPLLADKDLYMNSSWKSYLTTLAGSNNSQALDKLIPPAYQGKTTPDRLEAYAADLARKVRMSFPTQVVARMIQKGDLTIDANNAPKVVTFLKNATPLGFQLGRTPLNSFIKQNQASLFQGIASGEVAATTEAVKTLHRLYQITPSNESLQAAVKLGFTSSYDLATLDSQDFLDRFGQTFPSQEEALLVYHKAQQVNSTILNVYTSARQLDNGPDLYALSPSQEEALLVYRKAQQVNSTTPNLHASARQLDNSPDLYASSPPSSVREGAKAALIEQFPTLQSLFGSLDFCQCEDCRSVLSPAAYLVDLLRFIDPDDVQWKDSTDPKPYDVLVSRRPDLPHLPLTCENTNTVLPYIDVVNEIFEYYIVNDQLDAGAAYDTGEALSSDLMAEPQNILPQAYAILNSTTYPLGLPFDLWIETVRRFLGYFKTPLWTLLEVFKAADPLELFSDTNNYAYYRAGILAEYLGISPAEYAVFTNPNPLANWFTLYGYNDGGTALSELKSAKTLALRLGLSYQDLVNLITTGFLNPQLNTLVTLQKLGIQPTDVFSYEGMAGYASMNASQRVVFEALLDKLTRKYNPTNNASGFNARTWLNTTWNNGGFNQILLLADPDTGCNFDETTLQYANGTPATPSTFLKLNLFVRLWKKLGWTLDEIDRALQVFLTPNIPPDSDAHFGSDFAAALQTALVYLAHLQALFQQFQPGPAGRNGLLTCWSNLPTTGNNPLYAQLFLTPGVLNNDPVFDDPTGNYLSGSLLIKDHLLALQGALNLTSDEVGLILADVGLDVNTAPLSLANVSLLFRYGLLAKALNLTVADFLAVKALSSLNPFAPLSAKPLAVLADDIPWTQTIAFIQEAGQVKGSGFAIEDLQYLLRHQFDPVGKYSPDPNALMQLARSLSNDIHQIQSENAVPTDPLAFTDAVIKQKLALAFPADVVQTFMGMWTGSIQYPVVQMGVTPANKLDPATLTQFPSIQVSYDPVKQAQQLTYQGVLVDSQKAAIEAVNASPVLSGLLDAVEGQAQAFFLKYFQVSTIGQETIGFLPLSDFDLLFAPVPVGATDGQKQSQMSQKRAELASTFLPYLQQKLIRQTVVQAMVADLNADASLTDTLTTNASLLSDPTQSSRTLQDAFTGVAANGLSVTYYASTDGTGTALATGTTPIADTAGATEPKPAGTQSAHFAGYMEVPADGAYRFSAELGKPNAQVAFQFDFQPGPFILAVAPSDKTENFIELKAGIPYHFTLDFHNLGGGDASLLVQGENFPQSPLNQLTLYAESAVDRFTRAHVLLSKTLQLITGFNLKEREVTYLITHSLDFNNLSFSALPTQTGDDSPAKAATLFGQFLRLAAYANLRQGPAGGSDGLIDVFENAQQNFLAIADPNQSSQMVLQELYQTVANLTRRKLQTIQITATQLGYQAQAQIVGSQLQVKVPDLTQEKGFKRLWDALQFVQNIGISANALASATGIVDATQTQDARAILAGNLKNAVKAHYTPDAWRPIAKSIFDKLRQEKRDALSAYLVYYLDKQTTDQLFEYFLVDPGMEPVVQTSRLRLALSSVQTFIQRCLLNLEPMVAPSVIPANQWEWMKRYRVWQANREIFLWPENWMEPEWRLDKTDLFQALESTLLQGDVTSALVEDAFFTYLQDLDVRARLDIVTMYLEEVPNDPASNTLHVIGRNYGKPQKYFYRRFAYGTWTAWEPVKVDIEGDHLAAVVWRERLHLFWVTFSQKSKTPDNTSRMSVLPVDKGATHIIASSSLSTESANVVRQPYQSSGNTNSPTVSQMNFNELTQNLSSLAPQKQVQLQLNWSEYFQGKWSDRKSSDLTQAEPITVSDDFDPRRTYIYVAKETDNNGNEGAVKIMLDNSDTLKRAFRLVGKNSDPTFSDTYWEKEQNYDYTFANPGLDASKVTGSGPFQVQFTEEIQTVDGLATATQVATDTILQQGNDFAILVCDSSVMPMSTQNESPSNNFLAEALALGRPFFYQDTDNDITLFVQPSLTETTINEWFWWAIPVSTPDPTLTNDGWWNSIPLTPQVPQMGPINPGDPSSIYQVQSQADWVTNPATALVFGGSFIGQSGMLNMHTVMGTAAGSIGSFTTGTTGLLGNMQMTGVLTTLSGTKLNMIGPSGLNLAGLQVSKTGLNAVFGNSTLGQGGIS